MDYKKRLFLKSAVVSIGLLSLGVSFDSLSFAEEVTKDNYVYKEEVLDDKYPLVLSHININEKAKRSDVKKIDCIINYNGKEYVVDKIHNAILSTNEGNILIKSQRKISFNVKNIPNLKVKADDILITFTGDTVILDRNNVKKTFNSNEVEHVVYDYLHRALKYRKIDGKDLIQESF